MDLTARFAMLPLGAVLFASAVIGADVPAPPAQTVIDTAVRKAAAENKAILVHFSASW